MRKFNLLVLFVLLLSACVPSAAPAMPTVTPAQVRAADPPSAFTPTPEPAPPPTAIIAPTQAPNPTATPDTRLPPERWREWPVVPSATGRAIEIYRQGLALGNDPNAFSKAGDCQNIKAAFMGFFYNPNLYNLGTDYQYLQETIDHFVDYFDTDGQAVRGGFNAATVLSPIWADPKVCLPGENPIECELRLNRPSIVFVSFEFWWEGRTVETYEGYMRQIIETVIEHGAVPILATKADNVEGDHSLNLATARLAYEYDLPLWNFWLAVQTLPNKGLDPTRPDGFHISTDAWNTRSFTGLQTLDSVWRGVRDAAAAGTAAPSATATPAQAAGLLPTPASGPGLAGPGERIVFGLAARKGGQYQPLGVYLFDPNSRKGAQLLGAGYGFQSASLDGKSILVNQAGVLYSTDGSTLVRLTDQFFPDGRTGALWLPDGRIVLIVRQGESTALALVQADGSGLQLLPAAGAAPVELYPSTDGERITWASGACPAAGVCEDLGAWTTDLQTGESRPLEGLSHPLLAADGSQIAYSDALEQNRSNLAFASADGALTRKFPLPGDVLSDAAWSPVSPWLAVTMSWRSDYSGRNMQTRNFLVDAQKLVTVQVESPLLLNPRLVWSPDGSALAWFGTNWEKNAYHIHLQRVDTATRRPVDLSGSLGLTSQEYLFVTNAAWLKQP